MAQKNAPKKVDLYTATPEYQNFVASRRALPLFGIGRLERSCIYYFEYAGPKAKEDTALIMLVDSERSNSMYFDYDPEQPTSVERAGQPYPQSFTRKNKFTGATSTFLSKSYMQGRKYSKTPRKSTALGNQYFAAIRLDTLAPFLVSELIERYGKRRYVTMIDALKIKFYNGEGYRIFNKNYVSNFAALDPDDYLNAL
jgi:hypothetical protein